MYPLRRMAWQAMGRRRVRNWIRSGAALEQRKIAKRVVLSRLKYRPIILVGPSGVAATVVRVSQSSRRRVQRRAGGELLFEVDPARNTGGR